MQLEYILLFAGLIPVFIFLGKLLQFAILVGILAWLVLREPKRIPSPQRSISYGYAKPGETIPRRNFRMPELLTKIQGCDTVPDLISKAVKQFGSRPFIGSRKKISSVKETRHVTVRGKKEAKEWTIPILSDYKWISFDEVGTQIERFGSGLLQTGLKTKKSIAVFAETRAEWMIAATACLSQNISIVTVYASLGEEGLLHALTQTEVTHIITESELLPKVLSAAKKCNLNTVIYFEGDGETKKTDGGGVKVLSYSQVLKLGETKTEKAPPPTPEDLAIIMYTSGSTGVPKGVMVTHTNFISILAGMSEALKGPGTRLTAEEVYIAYLPLAHILELACEIFCMSRGYQVGYATTRTLKDSDAYDEQKNPLGDIRALRPTVMAAVPAILDRLKGGIMDKVEKGGPVMKHIFDFAYKMKKREFLENRESPLWDLAVFNKIIAGFGGRLKTLVSGGAPLAADTQEFFSVALNVAVLQGYGLTETCAGGTITDWGDRSFGHVGAPVPCCEIKLVDVPEMGYTGRDIDDEGRPAPRGEIAIHGGNVTQGYYKLPDKTKEDFRHDSDEAKDSSPWFFTGDIGVWLPDGALKIIDRKKDLVKLRHGEYIALGNLESAYQQSRYVENIALHCNESHDAPVALVVPSENNIAAFAKSKGIEGKFEEIVRSPEVKKEVLTSLLAEADKSKMKKWERVAGVHLVYPPWTPAEGLLTESLKIKRKPIYDHHKGDLEALYKSLPRPE